MYDIIRETLSELIAGGSLVAIFLYFSRRGDNFSRELLDKISKQEFLVFSASMEKRFDEVNERFNGVNERFDVINDKLMEIISNIGFINGETGKKYKD